MNVTKSLNPRIGFYGFGLVGLVFFSLTTLWVARKSAGSDFFTGALVMGLFSSAMLIVSAVCLKALSPDDRKTKLVIAVFDGMIGSMIGSALIGALQPAGTLDMLVLGALCFGLALMWPTKMSTTMFKRGLIGLCLGIVVIVVSVLMSTAIYRIPSWNPILITGFVLGALLTVLIAQPWHRD